MKRVGLFLLGCAFTVAMGATPAHAMPVFKMSFQKKYDMDAKVVTCDVCHVPMKDKKMFRNDYGQELAKLLDAEKFKGDNKLEGDAADKEVFKALEEVGKLKAKDGKTWEEHIKAGTIPGLKK